LYARVEERIVLESGELLHQARYPDVRVVEYPHGGLSGASVETGVAVAEPVRIHFAVEPMTETYIEIIDSGTGQRVVTAYRNGRYHSLDYRVAAEPPLEGPDKAWADQLLRQAGKR
jgi:hypothetical protein